MALKNCSFLKNKNITFLVSPPYFLYPPLLPFFSSIFFLPPIFLVRRGGEAFLTNSTTLLLLLFFLLFFLLLLLLLFHVPKRPTQEGEEGETFLSDSLPSSSSPSMCMRPPLSFLSCRSKSTSTTLDMRYKVGGVGGKMCIFFWQYYLPFEMLSLKKNVMPSNFFGSVGCGGRIIIFLAFPWPIH